MIVSAGCKPETIPKYNLLYYIKFQIPKNFYHTQALKRMPRRGIKSLLHLKGDSFSLGKLVCMYTVQIHFYIYLCSQARSDRWLFKHFHSDEYVGKVGMKISTAGKRCLSCTVWPWSCTDYFAVSCELLSLEAWSEHFPLSWFLNTFTHKYGVLKLPYTHIGI